MINPYPEQEPFIAADGRNILHACPGSGKTTAIALKLKRLTSCWPHDHSGVLAISFTNTAVDELLVKFQDASGVPLGYPHAAMTIDRFTNQYITLPFAREIVGARKELRIAEDDDSIDRDGFGWRQRKSSNGTAFFDLCAPSSINYIEDGTLTYKLKKSYYNIANADRPRFNAYCNQVKDWQKREGLLTTRDSAFWALQVLSAYPEIATAIVLRFPRVIIDEAQDTSAIQDSLLQKLIDAGLEHVDLVGDVYQSIFQWRDASPKLFDAKLRSDEWNPLTFRENRRSSESIIVGYSSLRNANHPKIISSCNRKEIPVTIFRYCAGNEQAAISHFKEMVLTHELNSMVVVARRHDELDILNGCKHDCVPWKEGFGNSLIKALSFMRDGEFGKAVRKCRELWVSSTHATTDWNAVREVCAEIENDPYRNAFLLEFLTGLPSTGHTIDDWTREVETYVRQFFELPAFAMTLKNPKKGSKYTKEDAVRSIRDVFFGTTITSVASTIHQVKGKDFNALLLFAKEDAFMHLIEANLSRESVEYFPTEEQSLLYVAMSRAETLLTLAVENTVSVSTLQKAFPAGFDLVDFA